MNVLVTGGAGYIGSTTVRTLLKAKHRVVVLDNLSHGHLPSIEAAGKGLSSRAEYLQASLLSENLGIILKQTGIEAVIHFAAFIEVGESVADPGKYYRNNVCGSLNLLQAMHHAGVRQLVFSSTAAVYGNPISVPITEDQARAPINPYGRSKMMVEMAIEDFAAAHGLNYAILRYFNVAGASADGGIGEAHEPETHLIPRILDAACGRSRAIEIYGTDYQTPDGTCIRDYVHVDDLADAHLLAMEAINDGRRCGIYNLGSEKGFSVREVIDTCREITGRPIETVEKPRRPGDTEVLVASSTKIKRELGWKPRFSDLRTIVEHAWRWHQRPAYGSQQKS